MQKLQKRYIHPVAALCREAGFHPGLNVADSLNIIDRILFGKEKVILSKQSATVFPDKMVSVIDIEPEICISAVLSWRRKPRLVEIERQFLEYLQNAIPYDVQHAHSEH